MSGTRHTGETIERSLRAVMAHNDRAAIAAVTDGRFVDLPARFADLGWEQLSGRWALDVIAAHEGDTLIDAWARAGENGTAQADVDLADGRPATILVFDMHEHLGTTMFVVIPGAAVGTASEAPLSPPIVPRYGVVLRNVNGFVISADDAAIALLRTSQERLLGMPPLDSIHPDDHKRAIDNWIETISSSGAPRRYRTRFRCGDGTWRWLEVTNRMQTLDDGSFEVVSEMVDISDEMAMHDALSAREEFLRRLTSALPVAVGQLDAHGHLVYANERLNRLIGAGDLIASGERDDGFDLFAVTAPSHRSLLKDAVRTVLDAGADIDLELRTTPRDATAMRVHRVSLCALRDSSTIVGALVCMTDVTESADLREALRRRATYDDLTGLHNRASIMALLENALGVGREAGTGTAVVFVDLDGFKVINDRFGHAVGDDVLVRVSQRLRTAVRRQDLVGRLGGDEFLVVCPDVADPGVALDVAERVGRHLSDELHVADATVRSNASIGVAWAGDDRATPESLIRAADAAMYEAKRAGTGRPILAGTAV